MFGWFNPVCPCDPAAKAWTEKRLGWLADQFGLHILLERPIIVPTARFFPDPWDRSEKAVERMFHRVCEYMGVDPDSVRLELFDHNLTRSAFAMDPTAGYAAGTWEGGYGKFRKSVIRLERGAIDEPANLIGTMAHELAHQRLLGERRYDPDAFDNELLTDLTTVYHGFGVFLANNPRKSTGKLSKWPGTQLHRREYISEPMLGYALAHLAWFRDEERPDWVKHLRWTPRAVYKQGLRYLEKTGDSSFRPVRLVEDD